MDSGLVIRTATASDARALAEFGARTFRDTFGPANRREDVEAYVAKTYDPARLQDQLGSPAYSTLMVEVGDAIAGFSQLLAGPPSPCVRGLAPVEMLRFYVDAPWHGHGVAQSLMRETLAAAGRLGARSTWLGVWEHNSRAIAFYGKSGFTDVGTQPFQLGADMQRDRVMAGPVPAVTGEAVIMPFRPEHTAAFYFLNRSWLDTSGLYEPADERYLADPQRAILEKGGAVFVAAIGKAVVGTAAIVPRGDGEVELTKLTVVPDQRGRGLGRRLAESCLEHARVSGARRVVLISHSKLEAALGLYESLGFTRRSMLPDHVQALADTCMELDLPEQHH